MDKDKNQYAIYPCRTDPYSGGIDTVIADLENGTSERVERFASLKDVFSKIAERNHCKVKDVLLEYYTYDDRIRKNVYFVLVKRFGDENFLEKYGSPQARVFLVDLDEKEAVGVEMQ